MFFFISGVSIQYNYSNIKSIKIFYLKRLIRLYPALWMSVIIGLIIMQRGAIPIDIAKIFWSLSGIWLLFRVPVLNPQTWFLGTIILFYLIFPFLSKAISGRPIAMMISILVLSSSSVYLLNIYPIYRTSPEWGFFDVMTASAFPLSNLFIFSLGVFLVQGNLFPNTSHNMRLLSFVSELTYPVYLIHGFLLGPFMSLSWTFPLKLLVLSVFILELDALIQKRLNIEAKSASKH